MIHTLVSLVGCGAPEPATAPSVEPVEAPEILPSPWEFESDGSEAEPPDLDALARALEAGIVAILTFDAEPVVSAYLDIRAASADATCPAVVLDPYGNAYWADDCTSPDGTTFAGYLSTYGYDYLYSDDAGVYYTGTDLSGNIALTGPAGTYDMEGFSSYVTGASLDGSIKVVQSALIGGFYFDSPDAQGWLSEATSGAALTISLIGYNVADTAFAVIADGAVLVEVDGADYSVEFDTAQLGNEAIGAACAEEPGGVVQIRDPSGRWFVATFHGPDLVYGTTAGDAARCEGCADLTLDGEPIGELCGDFEPWYQWEKIR